MPKEGPIVVEHPTGAEDPFDPVDPDDPYSITEPEDPLAPDDPDPEPTTTGGIEIPPPPPVTAPGSKSPPGHAELTAAVTKLGPLPDPKVPTEHARLKVWRVAQEGRFSLSEHWSMLTRLQLATAEVGVARADDPHEEQPKLDQLRRDLGTDGNLSAALDAWCAARDRTPVDLDALADAAARIKAAVDPLRRLLTVTEIMATGVVDLQRQLLGEALDGIVVEVASEARQALAGERVSRGAASDVATYHLEKMTRDANWASRLEASKTWHDVGRMVRKAIGSATLELPVSKASGKLGLAEVVTRFSTLDRASTARDSAGTPDYSTRSDVLRAYLGVADGLRAQFATLSQRQAELAGDSKSRGWDAAQTRRAGDVLAGVARALEAQLAADPLVQDPDLANAARKALGEIGALARKTSLEVLVDNAGTDLRKVWRKAKTSELDALKAAKVDLGDLPTVFEHGLGPLLDQWSAEIAKFPKHRPAKVKDLAARIAEQVHRYRAAINAHLGKDRSSGLVEGLDVVAAAMTRQIRSFDSRGGLFG
jgi:hypothetical protein